MTSSEREKREEIAWKFRESKEFDLNAGRNAFRSDTSHEDCNNADVILRRNMAMRSFMESVDSDFPPAPELPPSLNIDLQYPEEAMKKSETTETIIERKPKSSIHETISGTQKYPMMVPGPGHVDAEQELHVSLLQQDDEGSESDIEISTAMINKPTNMLHSRNVEPDVDHKFLRRVYSVSALERPRPTTPTSWCAIENYVESNVKSDDNSHVSFKLTPKTKQKIHVSIPNQNERKSRTTPLHDYDRDILEEDPRYRNVAPPKPVIHRWASTEWESFLDSGK
ncbi:unnamed protein product [Thelazia callipaeda]|uniref:HYLS1_C domain-containing protein n=1 Tax=Thelazia callipaeda TaxID=103827 RepID=A0A0N5DBG0_THECL|nr:unnamed protein product [Thelazia callipaeda]